MEERNQDNFNQMESQAKYPWSTNWSLENHYQPWYDDRRDYNTNAPSYYDYLANTNRYLDKLTWLTNRVARRNINVQSTNAIHYTKEFDWIDEGKERGINWHDVINLKCELVLSKLVKRLQYQQLDGQYKDLESPNSLVIENDGLYNPDVTNYLLELNKDLRGLNQKLETLKADILREVDQRNQAMTEKMKEFERKIDEKIGGIQGQQNQGMTQEQINNLAKALADSTSALNKLTKNEQSLQALLNSVFASGGITNNEIGTTTFKENVNLVTGNINVYTSDDKINYLASHANTTDKQNDLMVK